MIRACVALVFALTVAACGPKQFDSLCNAIPTPEGCGEVCTGTADCNAGYHCSADGKCDIQCTVGGPQCGDEHTCTTDGRCVPKDEDPTGGMDAACPAVNFTPMPVTPSISLVLDQSGSMYDNNIGTVTRYQAMRDAIVGTTGVVTQLDAKAYFGASLYTCNGANDFEYNQVGRAINNAGTVRTLIDSKLTVRGGNTPTHAAINRAVQSFQQNPAPQGSPPIIVLATDGLPNSCDDTPGGGEDASETAARAAYAAGIPLYVLAINISSTHFQDMANAGQGWQAGQPNFPYYLANDAQQLKAAFDTIIRGVISCDLPLTSGIDPAQAMSGTVVINGQTLVYGTDWILVNGNIIRVQGAACTSLKASLNPMVSATFPCGAVIL